MRQLQLDWKVKNQRYKLEHLFQNQLSSTYDCMKDVFSLLYFKQCDSTLRIDAKYICTLIYDTQIIDCGSTFTSQIWIIWIDT